MKVRTISAIVAGVAVLAGALVVSASGASAATSVTFKPQTVAGTVGGQNVVPLGSVSLNMTSTQTAYVVSVMRVNSATIRTLFDNEIVCKGPGGWQKNMVIGQNVYQTGGGSPQWEDTTLTTRYLVHPGVAGTVTCTANLRTASLGKKASTVRLVSGSLRFADKSVGNASTGTPLQASVPVGTYKVDKATPSVRLPTLDKVDVPSSVKGLSVFGDTEFMICPSSKVCNKKGSTTARFTLFINQWKSDGTLCYSDNSTKVTKTIPYYVHHAYVPLHKPKFTLRTGNGCVPRVNAYVKVDWLGGQAGAVQGVARDLTDSRGSSSTHRSDMSHIYAVPF